VHVGVATSLPVRFNVAILNLANWTNHNLGCKSHLPFEQREVKVRTI